MGADYYRLVLEQQYLCLELYQKKDVREYWHAVFGLFTSLRQHINDVEERRKWSVRAKKIRENLYKSDNLDKLPNLYTSDQTDINVFHEMMDEITDFYMDLTDVMDGMNMVLPKSQREKPSEAAVSMTGS